jgi:hypothetical protein
MAERSVESNTGETVNSVQHSTGQSSADATPPKGPGSHKRWDELKAKEKRLAEAEKKLADLEKAKAELDELKSKYSSDSWIEADKFRSVKAERDKLVEEIKVLDMTKDPEFQNTISIPLQNLMTEAISHVPADHKDEVIAALSAGTRADMAKRIHALAESGKLEPWQVEAIKSYSADAYGLWSKYRFAMANSKDLANRRETDLSERRRHAELLRQRTFDDELARAASVSDLAEFFKQDNESKAKTEERIGNIRQLFQSLDSPDNASRAAIWSQLGPELRAQNAELRKRIAQLESTKDKIEDLKDTSSNRTTSPKSSSDPVDFDMSPQGFKRRMELFNMRKQNS